jgi:predicted metalloprotease
MTPNTAKELPDRRRHRGALAVTAVIATLAALVTMVPDRPLASPADAPPVAQSFASRVLVESPTDPLTGIADPNDLTVIALDELMTYALADIRAFWNRTTGRVLSVRHSWVFEDSAPVQTACGNFIDFVALYCPPDDTVYLSYEVARAAYVYFGDMAVVAIIAHEFGHNLQGELNITRAGNGKDLELQADCFAGAYVDNARSRQLLEYGDRNDVVTLIRAFGDAGGSGAPDDPHGSASERLRAYRRGLNRGYDACLGLVP